MTRINFNDGWRFRKAGDTEWKNITLPHDAMLYEARDRDVPGANATGYYPGGIYEYEKTFFVPDNDSHTYIAIEFEGVYRNAVVSINGKEVCRNAYGYVPFTAVPGDALKRGCENIISVTADNSRLPNSRWYSGSGIIRPVNIICGGKKRIVHNGLKISTPEYSPATVVVDTEIVTDNNAAEVRIIILDGENVIAEGSGTHTRFEIKNASLWCPEDPHLYTCRAELIADGRVCDSCTESFGIRKVEWNAEGLFINGKETLLRGACIHHDNGVIGAVTYDKSEERRIRILRQFGFNAIRSSHNPASPELLRACDRLGMLVMDETWDMWYNRKNKFDYAGDFPENYLHDIDAMIAQDFNHPSVIMYSIGNEVSEPKDEKGVSMAREMVTYIHAKDPSRAVTAGINLMIIDMAAKGKGIYKEDGGRSDQDKAKPKKKEAKQSASGSLFFNMMTSMIGSNMNKMANSAKADAVTSPVLDLLDIAGYNYASGRYPLEGKKHPGRIVVGSETFPMDIAANWEMVKKYPYLIGDFMWTGWDYIGEAGIGAWTYTADGAGFDKPYPWLLADTGAVDITGFPNGEAYYASTVWGFAGRPYIGVRPVNHPETRVRTATWRGTNCFASWSWANCGGNRAEVEVYADAAAAELYLNGEKIGRKKIKAYKALFTLPYKAGRLEAVVFDSDGKELGRSELNSAKGHVMLSVTPEETSVAPGELVYVPVCIADENGTVESNSDMSVTLAVSGGELLGFGSANPRLDDVPFITDTCATYYGRALAVIRAGVTDDCVSVTASAPGMRSVTSVINIK